MSATIILKEKMVDGARSIEAFTSLTGALDSEGLNTDSLYSIARYYISDFRPFAYGNITFRKLKLNHYRHGKRKD